MSDRTVRTMPWVAHRDGIGRPILELLRDATDHGAWDHYAQRICPPCAAQRSPCLCAPWQGIEAMAWSPGDPTCPEWSQP